MLVGNDINKIAEFSDGRIAPAQRAAQFERLRDRIEDCAIRKFQRSTPPGAKLSRSCQKVFQSHGM